MADISDYLCWRGDITFEQDSFNDVDNLILAQIAYVDFSDIIPAPGIRSQLTLQEAARLFFNKHSIEELKAVNTFIKDVPFFMREAAATDRFKDVILSDYVDMVDDDRQMQFAAFHVHIPDGTIYVTFRGTDDSIAGWREDFNMSFMSPVPSQIEAVKYIGDTLKSSTCDIRLGGHSKGGNLAIYGAVMSDKDIQARITDVYNNDGPGFDRAMIEDIRYQRMLPKIKTIVPYHSFVGMLLEHEEDYRVVKSNKRGIMQHDAMSWQVMGKRFVTHCKVSRESAVIQEAMSKWINGMDMEERAEFVDALFSILTASGAVNLSDVNADLFKSAGAAIKMFNSLDAQTRSMLSKMLMSLRGEIARARKNV